MTPKIDTHQHCFPQPYLDAIELSTRSSQIPGGQIPEWSPERAIAMMDENGIAEGILSVLCPPVSLAPRVPRLCNDAVAELGQRYPRRFGSFASLPIPDIEASLDEIGYALDTLGAQGFIVYPSYEGRYLGDPLFAPLLEELNRRKAIVFVHPRSPPYPDLPIASPSVIEFPFETTRAAVSLILSGAMARYPGIKFILSHAGGTLPYLLPRLAISVSMMRNAGIEAGDPAAAMRAFYFDTALSTSAAVLTMLASVADPGHILFGSDFPMAPDFAIRDYGPVLDNVEAVGLDRYAIFRGNAERLLGRTEADRDSRGIE